MSCKLSEKCDNVFACNVLRPEVELLGCNFYKPKKPMTNEEWIRQANTEQLAEELLAWWFDGANTYSRFGLLWWFDGANTYSQFGLFKWEIDEAKEKIAEWLKQPHIPKE